MEKNYLPSFSCFIILLLIYVENEEMNWLFNDDSENNDSDRDIVSQSDDELDLMG